MQQGFTLKEAVRVAREELGDAPSAELAAYIREAFGVAVPLAYVTAIVGTSKERESLDRTVRAAREQIERWKAENPEEAKRLAATAKRREAAARRKVAKGAAPVEVAPGPEAGAATASLPTMG